MSNNDSGVDAGSDSNESGSMSFGSSAEEDSHENHSSTEDNSRGSFHQEGASAAEDWSFFAEPVVNTCFLDVHLSDDDDFAFQTTDQHDFSPKLRGRCPSRRRHHDRRWFFNKEIGERKLRVAANLNQIDYVQRLLEDGVDPKSSDNRKRTALHFASCKGNLEIARMLLERGADPNQKDVVGNTPLHLAVCANRIDIITLLLKSGTDLSAIDNNGRTALHIARSKMKLLQNVNTYSSSHLKDEVLQIIKMIQIYLQKSGKMAEVDHLSSITSRLHLHQTKEEVDKEVQDLLMSLAHLDIKF